MAADPDLKTWPTRSWPSSGPKRDALHAQIEERLLVDPSEDFSRLIVEIRAGTGGDEAALFAGNLYEMYTRYAREKGWKVEEIAASEGEAGGFKEISFGVSARRRVPVPPVRERRAPGPARPGHRDAGPDSHQRRPPSRCCRSRRRRRSS
jgi:protein subunit release factor A